MKIKSIFRLLLLLIASALLLYNAYIKLSANPGAVQLFSSLNAEPYGRILAGLMELLSGLLIIYPRTLKYGAILGIILMIGVLIGHFCVIGVLLGGSYLFFAMAVNIFICCLALVYLELSPKFQINNQR